MLTIYKASAGSGKTYTLAYEYVKLLLGVKDEQTGRYALVRRSSGGSAGKRHRGILAITFTNKATEEMKSRILKELAALASDDASGKAPYADRLCAEFGCGRESLRAAADDALRALLFDYHHFNVSTIDSFFQTVLRAFAREVDRQGDYGIELSDEYAVKAGISLMLDDLNNGNPSGRRRIMQWIRDYTLEQVESGGDHNVFNRSGRLQNTLASFVKRMSSEVFKRHSETVIEYLSDEERIKTFSKNLDARIDAITDRLAAEARKVIDALPALGFSTDAVAANVWRIFTTVAEKGDISVGPTFEPFTDKAVKVKGAMGLNDKSPYVVSKLPKGPKKTVIYPPESFDTLMRETLHGIFEGYNEIHALRIIRKSCPSLDFLGFAWDYIRRFREENNLILLSDTNALISRIIGDSQAPFIYERIGTTLTNYLIDEFQDTSHMQWNNLRPLVAESIAGGSDNLIIGDEKQAIYRFRNSDSALLHHVVAERDFPSEHIIKGRRTSENTNYRSSADIVRFNNTLFTLLAAANGASGYENIVQALSPGAGSQSGYVTVRDMSDVETDDDYDANFAVTAREIRRQHDAGYDWRDIAVLVRVRKEAVTFVDYLMKFHPDIKVISDEALLLANSPAVKQIVSMLKIVDASYSALSVPDDRSQSDGKVSYADNGDIAMMMSRYDFFIGEGYDSAEALRMALRPDADPSAGQGINDGVSLIRSRRPAGLTALVETIIETRISPRRRREEYAYIAAFQDTVLNYCNNYNPSVHAFLTWWEDNSADLAIAAGSNADAVSVMTVHKAKGLQWACVHVPFGDWSLTRDNESLWVESEKIFGDDAAALGAPEILSVDLDRYCSLPGSPLATVAAANRLEQIEDNLNITYVAYTRAERELLVCLPSVKNIAAEIISALSAHVDCADSDGLMINPADYVVADGEDGLIFSLGAPTVPSKKARPAEAAALGDYRVFFRDDTAALTTLDDATADYADINIGNEVPDSDSDEADADAAGRLHAAERGTQLHGLLADIDSPDAIDEAVDRLSRRACLDDATAEDYRHTLKRAFEGDEGRRAAAWFDRSCRVLNEQSIYMPEGDITFRPDRIIIRQDGSVEVIDYKFTSAPLESHRRQVKAYVALLGRMMPGRSISGRLWYPDLRIIEEI